MSAVWSHVLLLCWVKVAKLSSIPHVGCHGVGQTWIPQRNTYTIHSNVTDVSYARFIADHMIYNIIRLTRYLLTYFHFPAL